MNFTVDDVTHFSRYFAPLVYDGDATRSLHFQAGSFYWSDEVPDLPDDDYPASLKWFLIYLLSYRKVLMYGDSVPEFEPLWNHLRESCPNWPGFRSDRMSADLIISLEEELERQWDYLERLEDVCRRRTEHRRRMNKDCDGRTKGKKNAN